MKPSTLKLSLLCLVSISLTPTWIHAQPLPETPDIESTFQTEAGKTMPYQLWFPSEDFDPEQEYPLLVWMHPKRGSANSALPFIRQALGRPDNAAFLLKPDKLVGTNDGWHNCDSELVSIPEYGDASCGPGLNDNMKAVFELVRDLESEYASIDESRRVGFGWSQSAVGLIQAVMENPGFFSAGVSTAGGYDARLITGPVDTRLWFFHGHADETVDPFFARKTVEAINAHGGTAVYLEPLDDHGLISAGPAFVGDVANELYPWLFDGIEPPLAELHYDPSTGAVAVDAENSPGSVISEFTLRAATIRLELFAPEIDDIDGDTVELIELADRDAIRFRSSDGGFDGRVNLGRILPPDLDFNDVHGHFDLMVYDSPSAVGKNRAFHLAFSLLGDCNNDDFVSTMDLACQNDPVTLNLVQTQLDVLPGDFDGQNGVDFGDFLRLADNFGSSASSYGQGDLNLDGITDFGDFLRLTDNFGMGVTAAASVPEPSSALLAVVVAMSAGLLRRMSLSSATSRYVSEES